jgi:NAD dependent epimerase/dehydratase
MNWTSRKVLVTGAGGFIGSHLCEALIELGADVTAMIHYNSRNDWGNLEFLSSQHKAGLHVVAGNIEDSGFVAKQVKEKSVVFHLAALIAIPYSYIAPLSYVRTNVEGTLAVLEAARMYEVERIVHTSTSETYGTALYTPIDERHPLQGQSPYSASKIGADKIAESFYRSFNLPVVTVRPFNTYGPRQSARAVIPTIISQALTQNEIKLGALDPVRDLNYVKDTVQGFIKAATSPQSIGEVVNISAEKGITMGELATLILGLMECHKPIVAQADRLRPANSEVFKLIGNSAKAHKTIGWAPRYTLRDGLTETIAFISSHQHLYKTNQYVI